MTRLLGEGLDLTDPGTQQLLRSPLELLGNLLRGQSLSTAAHADQWLALASVAGVSDGGGSLPARRADRKSTHGGDGGAQSTNVRTGLNTSLGDEGAQRTNIRTGLDITLRGLAVKAMNILGGQATSQALRKEMRMMPEISSFGCELARNRKKLGITSWERNVTGNMGQWFEAADARRYTRSEAARLTARGKALHVYRLRGSAPSTGERGAAHGAFGMTRREGCTALGRGRPRRDAPSVPATVDACS